MVKPDRAPKYTGPILLKIIGKHPRWSNFFKVEDIRNVPKRFPTTYLPDHVFTLTKKLINCGGNVS